MAAVRAPKDGSYDVGKDVREFMELGGGAVVEGLATGVIEAGAATPLVAPLMIMLNKVNGVVDKAVRHKEELEQLLKFCCVIMAQVIAKYNASREIVGITPLKQYIAELEELSEDCNRESGVGSELQILKRGDRIENLCRSLDTLGSITAAAKVQQYSNQTVSVAQLSTLVCGGLNSNAWCLRFCSRLTEHPLDCGQTFSRFTETIYIHMSSHIISLSRTGSSADRTYAEGDSQRRGTLGTAGRGGGILQARAKYP